MLKDFDIAFTNKIKNWFSNTIYAPTDLVYNVAFNLVDDPTMVLKFPLISIYRPEGLKLVENQNLAARLQGISYFMDSETNNYSLARFLVANLAYQIDIYAKTPEALIDMSEDILQSLNFDPNLSVTQKNKNNNTEYVERYELSYNNGPSDQNEFSNDDRVYHCSIVYELKNARIVNFKDVSHVDNVEADVIVDEGTEDEN